MKIIFRTCENLLPANDPRPEWCMERDFKLKCFKSLINSIQTQAVELSIVGDALTTETVVKYKHLYPDLRMYNSENKLGNSGSLTKAFALADSCDDNDDIIFFCEDDYLFNTNFYINTLDFFNTVDGKIENVFFHPTDYPNQYNDTRIRKSYLLKSNINGWFREVDSTTFTFACKAKTYKKYSVLLKDCAIRNKVGYDKNMQPMFHTTGVDDARFSEQFGFKNLNGYTNFHQSAWCFCPLPGTASHMHAGIESLFFDWKSLYMQLTINEHLSN